MKLLAGNSNLPLARTAATLNAILDKANLAASIR